MLTTPRPNIKIIKVKIAFKDIHSCPFCPFHKAILPWNPTANLPYFVTSLLTSKCIYWYECFLLRSFGLKCRIGGSHKRDFCDLPQFPTSILVLCLSAEHCGCLLPTSFTASFQLTLYGHTALPNRTKIKTTRNSQSFFFLTKVWQGNKSSRDFAFFFMIKYVLYCIVLC